MKVARIVKPKRPVRSQARVILPLAVACLAFGAGACWDTSSAEGSTKQARDILENSSDTRLLEQALFRLHADGSATIEAWKELAKAGGPIGDEARRYLSHWRDALK